MRRLGFTLSEVIIALGLVGVIAAITSPMISHTIPDKKKVQVLKISKTVSEINRQLLNSTVFYYKPSGQSCEGLDCTAKPLDSQWNNPLYEGNSKYMTLLAAHLDTTSTSFIPGLTVGSFTTTDGMIWYFRAPRDFFVDLEEPGNNCVAGDNGCEKPDRFKFKVDKFGKIQGDDPLTKVYLANPNKLNDRRADYKAAGLIN